jgi:hypothetical protein
LKHLERGHIHSNKYLKTLSENWILLKRGQKIAGHTSEKEKKALKEPYAKN